MTAGDAIEAEPIGQTALEDQDDAGQLLEVLG
jgi:hypothetical protein